MNLSDHPHLNDILAGGSQLQYISNNTLALDVASAMFLGAFLECKKPEGFTKDALEKYLLSYKDEYLFNENQVTNIHKYMSTIATVSMLFKQLPREVNRLEDLDALTEELSYGTDKYDSRLVITEDEMPDWAWDKPKVAVDLALGGIAKNRQASTNDEIPGGIGRFGLDVTNPIPINGVFSIPSYLQRLILNDGRQITWDRKGAVSAENIQKPIDVYAIYAKRRNNFFRLGPKFICSLYISAYHKKNSEKAPEGFKFR